nr:transglutaminase N-terminal domain-containing protein [Bradyrhizobium sp. 76]
MAIIGEITHSTTYRYAKPVTFGTHRAMFQGEVRLRLVGTHERAVKSPLDYRLTVQHCDSDGVQRAG